MPRTRSGRKDCSKQSTKKYTSRKSPPYPANQCCGETKLGNDGNEYISVKFSTRSGEHCRWQLSNRKTKAKKKTTSARKTSTQKANKRTTSARKTSSRKTKKRMTSTRKTSPRKAKKRMTSARKTSTRKTSPQKERTKDWDLYKKLNWDAPTSRTWLGVVVKRLKDGNGVLIQPTATEVKKALHQIIREKDINIKVRKYEKYFYIIDIKWKDAENEGIPFGVDFHFTDDQHNQSTRGQFERFFDKENTYFDQPFAIEIADPYFRSFGNNEAWQRRIITSVMHHDHYNVPLNDAYLRNLMKGKRK